MRPDGAEPTGYAHPLYAASLAEWGTPLALSGSGGHVLLRPVPGTSHRDAMGPYPLFACRDWSRLEGDLDGLEGGLVSFAAVADPFGDHDKESLRRCFRDVVAPFKEHYVADLEVPPERIPSKHHRYYARKALESVRVEVVGEPAGFVDEWADLYANLARRHGIDGIRTFSRNAFAGQLRVPGMVAFKATARDDGETVGAHLWYVSGDVAYSHLAASSGRGYELMAAYALYAAAVEHFAGRVRWLEFGAGAGAHGADDGLGRFKRGWATGTRTAYFCGRILDRARYEELARSVGPSTGYFPAYRAGEFG